MAANELPYAELTEEYQEKWNVDDMLRKAVGCEKDDLKGVSNYMLYTIKAGGIYTINMRVENTLVFAYCNEENADELNKVMIGIGYFEE